MRQVEGQNRKVRIQLLGGQSHLSLKYKTDGGKKVLECSSMKAGCPVRLTATNVEQVHGTEVRN